MKDKKNWKEDLEMIKLLKRSWRYSALNEYTEEESRLVDVTVLVDALTKEVKEAYEAVERKRQR